MKMKVEIVKFNPCWLEEFNSEKLQLYKHLDNLVENIYHIGSTSIPGMAAKPIIDIVIEVYSLDELDKRYR